MVTYAEVRQVLDKLPQNLDDVSFLSDTYQLLSSYDGLELSREVKNALSRIRRYMDEKLAAPLDDLTPEKAVVLNDYLSTYKENELTVAQRQVKDKIEESLVAFDEENGIKADVTHDVDKALSLWDDENLSVKEIYTYDEKGNRVILPEYSEFEPFFASLKDSDLFALEKMLQVKTVQRLALQGYPDGSVIYKYAEQQKSLLRDAELQTRLTYLATEKSEELINSGKRISEAEAEQKYGITPEEVTEFNFSAADAERLSNAVKSISSAELQYANFTGMRIKQVFKTNKVWNKLKEADAEFAQKHPKLHALGKIAAQGGIVAAIATTGSPLLLSGYAASMTICACHKSRVAFKEKREAAKSEGKDFPYKNYLQYLWAKENRAELIGLCANIATSTAGVVLAGQSALTGQALNRMAKIAASVSASGAAGVALQREQAKARNELKDFLVSVGIREEDISNRKLYMKAKKYCPQLLQENNITLSPSQQEKFDEKLSILLKNRSAKRMRYFSVLAGAAAGFVASDAIKKTGLYAVAKPYLDKAREGFNGFLGKIIPHMKEKPLTEVAQDYKTQKLDSANVVTADTTLMSNATSLHEEIAKDASAPQTTVVVTKGDDIPDQKVSERLAQRNSGTHKTVNHENVVRPKANVQTSQPEQPSELPQQHVSKIDETVLSQPEEMYAVTGNGDNQFVVKNGMTIKLERNNNGEIDTIYSASDIEYTDAEIKKIEGNIYSAIVKKDNPTDIESQFAKDYEQRNGITVAKDQSLDAQANPGQTALNDASQHAANLTHSPEYYAVQPYFDDENTYIIKGEALDGVRIKLVEEDSQVKVTYHTYGSANLQNFTKDDFDEINKNLYTAISAKEQLTPAEAQFAHKYAVSHGLTEEQPLQAQPKAEQLQPQTGQVQDPQQQDGEPLSRREQRQQEREARRNQRQQERIARQRQLLAEKQEQERIENYERWDAQQGPTHKVDLGYDMYGYRCSASYAIKEIAYPDNTVIYSVDINGYRPEVDNQLYNYVSSTRVNASNGVQYSEAMGGAIKGHPSNFDNNVRQFCVELEQKDLVYNNLIDRQMQGYYPTEREQLWMQQYEREIASFGLVYDNGRLVPVLDNEHVMQKFYPNTIATGGKPVDAVNYRAANNADWDRNAYNTNNRTPYSVVSPRGGR
ncbi:MAG: hypothetical protein J6T72_00255 [Alphaproteobacteria bacterium]|nr:hypothetical protein [Alphaproteobacteria bacterium]